MNGPKNDFLPTKRFFIRSSRGKRNYLTSNLSKLPWVWNKKLDPTHSYSYQHIKTVNNSFLPIIFPSSLPSSRISKEDENKFKRLFLLNSNSLLKPLGINLKPLSKRSIGRNTFNKFMLIYSKEDLIEEFIKISILRKLTKNFDQLNQNDEFLTLYTRM